MSSQPPFPWQTSYWSKLTKSHDLQKLSHAYLITGLKGIGKYQFVYQFSKYLLCPSPTNNSACGKCDNCLLGKNSAHPDCMNILPADEGNVIKVDQIRSLTDFFSQTSHAGGAKIALIDDAHYLNTSASNALLKTLEEPSEKTFIFLCSYLPASLLPTLRSRCQTLQMDIPKKSVAISWLKKNIETPCDVNSLLNSAKGRPLYALDMQKSTLLADQKNLIGEFLDLTAGKIPIQLLVKSIKDAGEVFAVECLINLFSNTTKALFHGGLEHEISPQEKEFLKIFTDSNPSNRNVALVLIKFYDELVIARRHLSATNLNARLIIESLVWQWHNQCQKIMPQRI